MRHSTWEGDGGITYGHKPGRPCAPDDHRFLRGGLCRRCEHRKDDLLRNARRLLQLNGEAEPQPGRTR